MTPHIPFPPHPELLPKAATAVANLRFGGVAASLDSCRCGPEPITTSVELLDPVNERRARRGFSLLGLLYLLSAAIVLIADGSAGGIWGLGVGVGFLIISGGSLQSISRQLRPFGRRVPALLLLAFAWLLTLAVVAGVIIRIF